MKKLTAAAPAGPRVWLALVVLDLATLLIALDFSVMYLALPHISRALGASGTEQLWISDVYGFLLAGFLITMGTLGDRIGRRRLLLAGAAVFGVASVLAAFSTSVAMLLVARAVLGIAAAAITPSSLALVGTLFTDPKQRGTAIGIWISCFMGGTALGPVVGGALLDRYWWGAAFLVGVPVMLLVLVTGPILLPEYRNPGAGRLDLVSVALLLATILPVVYGVKQLAAEGWAAVPVLAACTGLAVGTVFVRRQAGLSHPLLDLRLFADRAFRGAMTGLLLHAVILGGLTLLVNQYVQLVAGFSPLRTGLWTAPGALAIALTSLLAPLAVRRFRPAYVISAGLVLTVLGCLCYTQVDADSGPAVVLTGYLLMLLGGGPIVSLSTALILGSAPEGKAGAAAALKETSDNLGVGLGIAVMGSIGNAVYHHVLTLPTGLPDTVADTTRRGIASATALASSTPAFPELLAAAREAFSAGVRTAGLVGAGLTVLTIAIVLRTLRHIPASDHAQRPEATARVEAPAHR